MNRCPHCASELEISRIGCRACGIELSGRFVQSRLARLSGPRVRLAEELILVGGNLKELAKRRSLSYPTLRKQLNDLIVEVERLRGEDERHCAELLEAVERGDLRPEQAARMIEELGGGP